MLLTSLLTYKHNLQHKTKPVTYKSHCPTLFQVDFEQLSNIKMRRINVANMSLNMILDR